MGGASVNIRPMESGDLNRVCGIEEEVFPMPWSRSAFEVELASENEFKGRFPDCEVGAMPPFGNLFEMRTLVQESLTEDEEIAFSAGSHTELIRMAYADFAELVRPEVLGG